MISRRTIDQILDSARIDEVVREFVTLKKRGSSLVGLCPFHNEKTPSFNVSPAKGIYKCFGCGKAGNAVNFIMEHERYSYPEALRYLAAKYNIEVEEDARSERDTALQGERESLFLVSAFAARFFEEYLFGSEEGRSAGLTYFQERGYDEKTIRAFQLGMAPSGRDALVKRAQADGYQADMLVKAGLAIRNETTGELYDRFRGRVVFPIHNVTGKVIAFGARILRTDAKAPKYINSPETEIYHKSRILYGMHHARKAAVDRDECFLVEGYTDVISLHAEGITNAVASSGTSLTVDQVRLVGRYTRNITILFDGDAAGIKASLRGIDLILEEGLNVKVVLFPDGEDPDSFARKHGHAEVVRFLDENKQDFIRFKTALLLGDVADDPVGKSKLIRDIVETISRIPDAITREMYVKHCAVMLEVTEQTLMMELNAMRRRSFSKQVSRDPVQEAGDLLPEPEAHEAVLPDEEGAENQEAEVIRILLNYGDRDVDLPATDEEGKPVMRRMKTRDVLLNELMMDGLGFDDAVLAGIFSYFSGTERQEFNRVLDELTNHSEEPIREAAIEFLSSRYALDDWERKGIYVRTEEFNFRQAVLSPIYHLKLKRVMRLKKENRDRILECQKSGEPFDEHLRTQQEYDRIIAELSRILGVVVVR